MPFGRNNHCGRRSNSGRKRTSDTLGPLDRQGGLHRFFGGIFGGRQTQNVDETQNNEDTDPTAMAIVPVTNAETTTETPTKTPTETPTETPALPNYDTQDDNFHVLLSLSRRGKTVADPENLSFQRKAILEKSFYHNACKNISDLGVLWYLSPSYIKRPKFGMKDRWKDFFQLRVFNWIPELMIGNDWVPLCPNCNNRLQKNDRGCAPRIVFDQTEDYWLNAPNKYICLKCKEEAEDPETNETDK